VDLADRARLDAVPPAVLVPVMDAAGDEEEVGVAVDGDGTPGGGERAVRGGVEPGIGGPVDEEEPGGGEVVAAVLVDALDLGPAGEACGCDRYETAEIWRRSSRLCLPGG
jgi:hypothetical protein